MGHAVLPPSKHPAQEMYLGIGSVNCVRPRDIILLRALKARLDDRSFKNADRADASTVVAEVVAPVDIARIEVQAATVQRMESIERTRPTEAVAAHIAEARVVAAAGSGQEY